MQQHQAPQTTATRRTPTRPERSYGYDTGKVHTDNHRKERTDMRTIRNASQEGAQQMEAL